MTDKKHPDEARYGKRVECQVFSRVVGFVTATRFWNEGKRLGEWPDRVPYVVPEKEEMM